MAYENNIVYCTRKIKYISKLIIFRNYTPKNNMSAKDYLVQILADASFAPLSLMPTILSCFLEHIYSQDFFLSSFSFHKLSFTDVLNMPRNS